MKLSAKAGYLAAGVSLAAVIALAAMAASNQEEEVEDPDVAGTCLVGTEDCDDTPNSSEDPKLDVATGIEVLEFDGVTVFQHDPEAWLAALHTGVAEIVNGCLVVDGAVVVWHADSIDRAGEAIAAIKNGEAPSLTVGGGGASIDEGGSIPKVVSDNCVVSTVWFAAP